MDFHEIYSKEFHLQSIDHSNFDSTQTIIKTHAF